MFQSCLKKPTHNTTMSFHEDLDEIVPNLFLGSWEAATSTHLLRKYNISHILTIETSPLPRYVTCLRDITAKFIELLDMPSEDLLSHFDDTFGFIEKGVNAGGVLVHCYYGVSRSATVVIAYLMKKYGWNYTKAFKKVKSKRRFIYPNEGFALQMKLYEEMGCNVEKSETRCKLFRLKLASEKIKEGRNVPHTFLDLIQPNPKSKYSTNALKCKNCHHTLGVKDNVFPHQERGHNCTKTHYLEPISWMKVTEITKGELNCPECKQHVGGFSWLGYRCSCDFKLVPAFYLNPSETY